MNHLPGCVAVAIGACFLLPSCASVPGESVTLSEDLTGMIRSAESSHLTLVDEFAAERKTRAEEFLESTWIPTFMETAVRDSRLLALLSAQPDATKKTTLLTEFSESAAKEIARRRASVMDAIDEVRNALRESVTTHYEDMITVNQALTAHLRSAANVTETREQLLASLNVKPESIIPIDKVNDILSKILSATSDTASIRSYIDKAKAIIKGK